MRVLDGAEVLDTRDDPRWQPLCVHAVLTEPVVTFDGELMLDGPLSKGAYYEWVHEHGHYSLPPMTSDCAVDFDLPLATWTAPVPRGFAAHPLALNGEGRVWGWCCSRAQVEWLYETKVELRKKPAIGEMVRRTDARDYHAGLGPTKAKDLAFPAKVAWEVRWYALGDRDRVADLLSRVPGIGKLCHHGHGSVERWSVEPMGPLERERWMDRLMPADGGLPASIRAPHHHRTRRVPCR